MGVTTRQAGGRLQDLVLTDRDTMREIGLLARERIVRRTLSGQDENDGGFAPYSAAYAALKAKELGSATPVNLQVSGRMLQGIVIIDLTENSVTLGFKD